MDQIKLKFFKKSFNFKKTDFIILDKNIQINSKILYFKTFMFYKNMFFKKLEFNFYNKIIIKTKFYKANNSSKFNNIFKILK